MTDISTKLNEFYAPIEALEQDIATLSAKLESACIETGAQRLDLVRRVQGNDAAEVIDALEAYATLCDAITALNALRPYAQGAVN